MVHINVEKETVKLIKLLRRRDIRLDEIFILFYPLPE